MNATNENHIAEPSDPRSIANLLLDQADEIGVAITNLALQKLLYFAHGIFLVERKTPLVSGYFEAWQYGPVHPALYQAFKAAGDSPITFRATRQDLISGVERRIEPPSSPAVIHHIARILAAYGHLTPGRLIEISHAKGAPWDFVVCKGRGSVALGLLIGDNVIIERFKHHKVMVGLTPIVGDPIEDSPFGRN